MRAVLLTNSCARGKATADSCLDMAVVLQPNMPSEKRRELEQRWQSFKAQEQAFVVLERQGLFSDMDLVFTEAKAKASDFLHGWTSGPDNFELEIGNTFVYSVVLWEQGGYFSGQKAKWLPYYDDRMRSDRLKLVDGFFRNNIKHIRPFAARELWFAAHRRLYLAFGEFLQALFIFRRVYPIAYDKHVKEQVVEILGDRQLYERLTHIFEINDFESNDISNKAENLQELMDEYVNDAHDK